MLAGVLIIAAAQAAAAPAPAAEFTAEEIIVTGERARRTLKDTPSSVAVFDKRDLDRMAAPDRIQQVLELIPNVLTVTSRDAPVIRGQNSVGVLQALPAFLGGARPRTVMQIDGRTVTFNEFVNSAEGLWDVDHIEVFRSPQTTTQGVNSIAGAIFIHTADPTYGWEGRARVIAGEYRRRQGSAVVSGPVVGDQLALRISGDVYRSIASTRQSGPVVGIADLNPDRYWTVRAKLLAEPHFLPGLRLLTTYAHTDAQAVQGEVARPPFRARRNNSYIFGYFKSDVDSVTTLASVPLASALNSRTTLSWGRSHFRRFAPQGFGQTAIHARDRSIESVLDWKPGGLVSGIGGVSYQAVDLNQFIDLSAARLGTGSFSDEQRSLGVFGELAWKPTDRVTLITGARYQRDSKKRAGVLRKIPELPLAYDNATYAFLPKVSVAYDLARDWRVGLMVQRAYNPGGVTLDPAHQAQRDFKPEYLWDYEAFTRAGLFGGRVSVIGNLFYNDMRDAQRELDFDLNSPAGQVGLLQIVSEPRARAYGAELEVMAKLSSRLSLRGAAGLLSTRITKTVAPNDPFRGKEFASAPHFTGTAAVDWTPLRSLRIDAQLRHNSGFWGDDSEDPLFRTTGWTTVNARVNWDRGPITIFGYAQNLFDRFHVLAWTGRQDDPSVNVGLIEPREVGLGVETRF
jgi:outer membrane receptor protein involved in Fe transport